MRNKIHQQTFIQATFWLAAAAVGAIAVLYARIINEIFKTYSAFFSVRPYIATAATPFLFVLATYLVVKFSPQAKGSGIPQVLTAISYAKKNEVTSESDSLVSLKTAVVKVVSSLVGFIAGASIGREGPTVQISASIFSWVGHKMKSKSFHIDPQSYLIAGGAAGVAAAFNTPLAGITTQAFVGDYLYFGHPAILKNGLYIIPEVILIGAICGLFGGLFA